MGFIPPLGIVRLQRHSGALQSQVTHVYVTEFVLDAAGIASTLHINSFE